MKKMLSKEVGGFYVGSIVLGILFALTITLLASEFLLTFCREAFRSDSENPVAAFVERDAFIQAVDHVWGYLPMRRFLNAVDGSVALLIVSISAVVLGVSMFKPGTKEWRTKYIQATAFFFAFLFVALAFDYATIEYSRSALTIIPVLLLTVPLLVLKKTRVVKPPKKEETPPRKPTIITL